MAKKFKILGIVILIIMLFAVGLTGCIFYENYNVKITDYTIVSNKITSLENGGKIAVIADFHNSENYNKIIDKTKKAAPDVIIIAGDFVNMNDTNFSNAEKLMIGLVNIAPVYFVSGNHERWLKVGEENFLDKVKKLGANILNQNIVEVAIKQGKITITGYQDIIYSDNDIRVEYLNAQLEGLYSRLTDEQKSMFNLLVFHRGNLLHNAARQPYDLIVSGHLHGGQINIPKIRETVVKEKVGSSEFVKGYYNVDGVKAIISGGLENNSEIKRLFNMPEIVMITLKSIKD